MRLTLLITVAIAMLSQRVFAADPPACPDEVRSAITRSLALLEKASAGSADQRECFTCHSQALPVLAFVSARQRGFTVDEANLERQVKHTYDHLQRGLQLYKDGKGQGGKADTAGYALWTLAAARTAPDEVTAQVADWMLRWQSSSDHWETTSKRPPTEASDFTSTYLVVRSLKEFATQEQQPQSTTRIAAALNWLKATAPDDHEDRVFRLWGLKLAGAESTDLLAATEDLLSTQQPDGGWQQTGELSTDAYATGTALVALAHAGDIKPDHDAYQRGVNFLMRTQLEDGSWHVVTRSKPIQTYFETGFPHDLDQFISTYATGWAVLALLETLEPQPAPDKCEGAESK